MGYSLLVCDVVLGVVIAPVFRRLCDKLLDFLIDLGIGTPETTPSSLSVSTDHFSDDSLFGTGVRVLGIEGIREALEVVTLNKFCDCLSDGLPVQLHRTHAVCGFLVQRMPCAF